MHERSITVESDGTYYNIPSVAQGRQLSDEDATAHAKRTNTLGTGFPDLSSAIGAAKKRSATFDHQPSMPRQPSRGRIPLGRREVMTPLTSRNLFRYPLFLTPEAYFLVCRHEVVYAALIPLWLQARGMLPRDIVIHGIMPSQQQTAVTLLCEAPGDYPGHWYRAQGMGDAIDCSAVLDFPCPEEVMLALNAFIATHPHQRHVEAGPLRDVFDTETMALLMEKESVHHVSH